MSPFLYSKRSRQILTDGPSWMFKDNKSIVASSTLPHSTSNKRLNVLSYHEVREAVASGIVCFENISTNDNPANILTKPLPWHKARTHVEPLLFWKGECVKFSRSGSPEHYEYACEVFHKLSKFRSLSSAQNCLLSPAQIYLILTMPRDRSLVLIGSFDILSLFFIGSFKFPS